MADSTLRYHHPNHGALPEVFVVLVVEGWDFVVVVYHADLGEDQWVLPFVSGHGEKTPALWRIVVLGVYQWKTQRPNPCSD